MKVSTPWKLRDDIESESVHQQTGMKVKVLMPWQISIKVKVFIPWHIVDGSESKVFFSFGTKVNGEGTKIDE